MPDTIKVPGIGPLEKKYAYIGIAGVAGFVGYAYWRNRQSAPVEDTGEGVDTTALDDANAAASDWGYAYGDSGDGGYAYGGGSPIYQSPINGNYPTPTGGAPSSDPQWAQEAVEWLENVGVERQAASHAISTFLADLCLTGSEADYVRQAKAGLGDPPQTHHNIQICTTTPPPSTGTNAALSAPQGLHVTSTSKTSVNLAWFADAENPPYIRVYRRGVSTNIKQIPGNSTTVTITGLKANTKYYFHLRASDGTKYGPSSNEVSGTTKK